MHRERLLHPVISVFFVRARAATDCHAMGGEQLTRGHGGCWWLWRCCCFVVATEALGIHAIFGALFWEAASIPESHRTHRSLDGPAYFGKSRPSVLFSRVV